MNRDEMIEYYLSLMPNDIFDIDALTKEKVRKRLRKLTTNEIEWEIKSAENILRLTGNWD